MLEIEEMTEEEFRDLPDEVEASIENVYLIKKSWSCKTFVWGKTKKEKKDSRLLIDAQTANLAITVYEALNDENKLKVAKMIAESNQKAYKFFDFCWKQVNKT